jgi:hypothetical protein
MKQKKLKFCKHWIELDNEAGNYEYCRGERRKAVCCGVKSQCVYPDKFKEEEGKATNSW